MKRRIKLIWKILLEELALFTIEFLLVIAVGLLSLIGFVWFSRRVLANALGHFDSKITAFIKSFDIDSFMKGITFLGNREFIIIPTLFIFIYFLFIRPHRWFSIKIPVVALGSISGNLILKELFGRSRPMMEHMVDISSELSFPSGHAMFSISFYGLLIYITWNFISNAVMKHLISGLLSLLILLIGTSRIYLGVHYPSDVIAGFAAGFLWLSVSIMSIRLIEKYLKEREKERSLEHAQQEISQ